MLLLLNLESKKCGLNLIKKLTIFSGDLISKIFIKLFVNIFLIGIIIIEEVCFKIYACENIDEKVQFKLYCFMTMLYEL